MNALLEKLRLWLGGKRKPAPDTGEVRMHQPEQPEQPEQSEQSEPGPHANLGEHGAAHPEEDPEDLHRGRRRLKESHTSHWDLDYMSRDEMEKLAETNRRTDDKDD